MSNNNVKTKVATFRLTQDVFDSLKKEASDNGINVNALVTQILKRHFEIHLPASKAGLVYFSKHLVKELVSLIPDEKAMSNIASRIECPELTRVVYMTQSNFDAQGLLWSLFKRAEYGGFTHSDISEDGLRTISFKHDMGPKYGQLMRKALEKCVCTIGKSYGTN